MYVGGTDERALHHLVAEVLDNAMDEAVAGFANRIELELGGPDRVVVRDNGRGIPVDPHPKFPGKSALEVILTTLHSGGKFGGKAYETSGGLHGVGVSVVNALSAELQVEVARNRQLFAQTYRQGQPQGPLRAAGAAPNRRGTTSPSRPIPRSSASTRAFGPSSCTDGAEQGLPVPRRGDPLALRARAGRRRRARGRDVPLPGRARRLPEGADGGRELAAAEPFAGEAGPRRPGEGRVGGGLALGRGALRRLLLQHGPHPQGGTHEAGLRNALLKGLRAHAERSGFKKAALVAAEDVQGGACVLLSLFFPQPQFQGQTKERLVSPEATGSSRARCATGSSSGSARTRGGHGAA
jgi:topoisomerase-4 subunit B